MKFKTERPIRRFAAESVLVASLLMLSISAPISTLAATSPTITNVTPSSGSTSGGTLITITGTDFAPDATVMIDNALAASTVVGSSTITATTPARAVGAADVSVTNTDGGSATSTASFLYEASSTNLTSIAITHDADKLTYHIGEALDITSLVVTGTYSDGSTAAIPITDANVFGFNTSGSAVGQVLTIATGTIQTMYSIDVLPEIMTFTDTSTDGNLMETIASDVEALALGTSTTTLKIFAGTEIADSTTGTSTWNGTFTFPVATTSYTLTPSAGHSASTIMAVEIGAGNTPLMLSQPAKITFEGQAGTLAGWSQAGVFTPITAVCSSTSTPALATSSACVLDDASDLIVWTNHLSTFIVYTESTTATPAPTTTTAPSTNVGGNGPPIGFFGSIFGNSAPVPGTGITTTTTVPTLPVTGQVLGASTYNFTTSLSVGSTGEAVTALQNLLTAQGHYNGPITGYFGPLTRAGVIAFQAAHGIDQVGIVGPQTRAALNSVQGGGNTMSDSVRAELISQLQQKLQQILAQIAILQSTTTPPIIPPTSTTTASTTSLTATTTAATSTTTATSTTP